MCGLGCDGHQHVGFRIVGGRATFGRIVRNRQKEFCGAGFTFEVTGDIDRLFRDDAACLHIFWIHEDHTALVLNAAIAVVGAIDGGIELVVTAEGL